MTWMRRWGGYLALTVAVALACALLSWWQWARRAEAVAEIERIERNFDAPAVPLTDLLGALEAAPADAEWRPVTLSGEYLAEESLLVRNRPRDGEVGFEQVVPLRLDDGTTFVVDRGWVPGGATPEAPDEVPAIPAGRVTVEVRLKPGEPDIPGRSAPEGQLATVRLPDVAERLGSPTYTGMYGLLVAEQPAGETGRLAVRPVEDEGPHLSYALQWIAFGILAFVGLFWAVRRERRIARGLESPGPKRRRDRDSDAEDALLDA